MRYFWAILLLALFGKQAAAASTCDTIKVATHPNYPPFHYSQNGSLVGPSIELAKQLVKDLNLSIEIMPSMPWRRVLAESEKGAIDMVVGLKNTKEREAYLLFSDVPVFANPMSVFVKQRTLRRFRSWLDLVAHRGAVSAGDRFGTEFDAFSDDFLTLASVAGQQELIDMLLLDRVEYIIAGNATAKHMLNSKEVLTVVPAFTVNTGLIYLALSKQSSCKNKMIQINRLLLHYLKNKTFTNSLDKVHSQSGSLSE